MIFLALFIAAIVNLLTKEVATITGVAFTVAFYAVFWFSEHAHRRRLGAAAEHHEHLEQFNEEQADKLSVESLHLTKPYRKLVAIRSPYNLGMLERCLAETDPETTEVVVMTASVLPPGSGDLKPTITERDRQLLTAVVNLAEHAGKPVRPVIVPTNEPFFAMTLTAKTIGAQELIMGPSNKYRPEDQLDQVALYWMNVCDAKPEPLSIRVLGKDRDVRLDIAGGSQIPKAAPPPPRPRISWRSFARAGTGSSGCSWPTTAARSPPIFSTPSSASSTRRSPSRSSTLPRTMRDPRGDRPDRGGQAGRRARRRAGACAGTARRVAGRARRARPRNRPDRRRRQVRRHLHEPARRLSPRRHHGLRLQHALRPRARPLPRDPRVRTQIDTRPAGRQRQSRAVTSAWLGPSDQTARGPLYRDLSLWYIAPIAKRTHPTTGSNPWRLSGISLPAC